MSTLIRFQIYPYSYKGYHIGDKDKAMASHGSVSQFDSKKEEWTSYVERMRHYFIANDVVDAAKKKSILISSCGPKTFRLIRSLLSEEALETSTW